MIARARRSNRSLWSPAYPASPPVASVEKIGQRHTPQACVGRNINDVSLQHTQCERPDRNLIGTASARPEPSARPPDHLCCLASRPRPARKWNLRLWPVRRVAAPPSPSLVAGADSQLSAPRHVEWRRSVREQLTIRNIPLLHTISTLISGDWAERPSKDSWDATKPVGQSAGC